MLLILFQTKTCTTTQGAKNYNYSTAQQILKTARNKNMVLGNILKSQSTNKQRALVLPASKIQLQADGFVNAKPCSESTFQ